MNSPTSLKVLSLTVSALVLSACQPAASNDAKPAKADPASKQVITGKKAKNVILFVGDGMGISTITAARIFDGQSKGMSGEDNKLSFDEFPHVSLVKTYNLDSQVADSAGTASAMNTGMKTQIGKSMYNQMRSTQGVERTHQKSQRFLPTSPRMQACLRALSVRPV